MSIQYLADLNSQPSDYESPPLTTRPGLPPRKHHLTLTPKLVLKAAATTKVIKTVAKTIQMTLV